MGRKEGNPVHNGRYTQAYNVWANMKQRCDNPNVPSYKNYGGRGITYCPAWITFIGFERDMGQPPTPEHTLERTDNNKGYNKENCIWATRTQQANNRRMFQNNTSGLTGVNFDESKQHWVARVYFSGQRLKLYSGPSLFEAACIILSWRNKYD